MDYKVIAIDGPAGAGKSTIAKKLSDIIGYTYIDSGAMYRAVTLKVLRENVPLNNTEMMIAVAEKTVIDFKNNSIFLDGEAVNNEIREESINKSVSIIAAISEIRKLMVNLQRKISKNKNVVMDGRDVGTVIFPEADIKFYITATVDERADRRYKEFIQKGCAVDIQDIKSQIEKRDHIDSTRADSPLKAASNAIMIDTTGKSIEEVLEEVISHIKIKGGGIVVI